MKTKFSKQSVTFAIIVVAMVAFELFNYLSTEYSLSGFFGQLKFLDIKWSAILALAFCGIDFAGVARIFPPQRGKDEPLEIKALFGAWMVSAVMNATLTWWGVGEAMIKGGFEGNVIMSTSNLLYIVPAVIAGMVFLVRFMLISAFSMTGEKVFHAPQRSLPSQQPLSVPGFGIQNARNEKAHRKP